MRFDSMQLIAERPREKGGPRAMLIRSEGMPTRGFVWREFVAALILLPAILAYAQESQFLFDPNGNLFVQTGAATALPQILAQPQNRIVAPDEAATFTVVAADTRLITFQWRFNGTNISNATNDAVLRQNVTTNHEGEYRVVLTNPSGSITSAPAFLMIDSDADGMGDSWELSRFGSLTNFATADFDGDGVSNLTEFFDDTNPTNKTSVRFRITVVTDGDGVVELGPNQASYTNGQTVTLTATPSGTNLFYGWTGDVQTNNNPVLLTMTSNKTVRAHFQFLPLEIVWTNLAGGEWHSATNWSPNQVPGATDHAIIPITATVTLSNSVECFRLTLGSGSGSPTLTGNGTLTVHENFSWVLGTMSGSGLTIVETNATLNIARFVNLNTRTLQNRGTILVFNEGGFSLSGGGVITNCAGALFHVVNQTASLGGGLANGRFDNAGTFRKSSGIGTLTVNNGLNFNNSGVVDIQTGTLVCSGGFTNSGAVNVSAGATHRLEAGGLATGSFTAQSGALIEWTGGTFTLNSGAQLTGAGLYRINVTATVTANANHAVDNLELMAGTLNGAGIVTISNLMNWTGGTMSGSGRTIIPAGATLNAAIPSSVSLSGRTLENGGTVLWTGAGFIGVVGGGVVTNRVGALFHFQNASFLGGAIANGRFDNAGTFRKSANAGTSTISSGMSFNNTGSVEIQAGTLALSGGGTHTGSFDVPVGTAVDLSGTHSGSASSSFTGAGQFTVSGGTANLAGLVNVSGSNIFSGGTANLTGNYICTNSPVTIVGGTANFSGSGAVSLATVHFASGTLTGTSSVTINTVMNWTGGTMSGSGRTIIPAGVTLNAAIPSSVSLSARTLENGGTVLWTGAGIFGVINGAVITNRAGALFHAQNAATIGSGIANGRFDNAGTFRKSSDSGTSTVSSGLSLNNTGTVELQTGTLLCGGTLTNNGAVILSAGTTNRLAGGGSAAGSFTAGATALVEWTGGTFTLNPGAQLNGTGLYRINGISAAVVGDGDVTVQNLDLVNGSSTWSGTGILTIANTMNWSAGTMEGSGRTLISPAAMLQLGGVSLKRTLENAGNAFWSAGPTIILLNGIITNRAGALFDVQNAGRFFPAGGTCRFDNNGTYRKSVSIGTNTWDSGMSFNNYGTVDIRSGVLLANGSFISTSNALLNCALGGTTPGTGYGQLQVSGAVTLNGSLGVDFTNSFSPALNDSFTVLTAGSRNGAFANFFYLSNAVTMQLSNTANSVIVSVTAVATPPPVLLQPEIQGNDLKLTWTAVSNVTYRLEFNPDLANLTNWNAVPGDVTAATNTASKLDPLTSSNRFYRTRVLP